MDEGTRKVIVFPPWQRQDRHDDKWRSDLINNLYTGMTVNDIILSERIVDGKITFRVVDGGHRTRAILRFVRNEYPIISPTGKTIYYSKVPSGASKKDAMCLTLEEQRIFDQCQVDLKIHQNLDDYQERVLFNFQNATVDMSKHNRINAVYSTFLDSKLRPFAEGTEAVAKQVISMRGSKNQTTWLSLCTALFFMAFDNTGADIEDKYLTTRLREIEYDEEVHGTTFRRITTSIETALEVCRNALDYGLYIGIPQITKMFSWLYTSIVKDIYDGRTGQEVEGMLRNLRNIPTDHPLVSGRNLRNGSTLGQMKKRKALLADLY